MDESLPYYSNLLMVGGTSKKSGKTSAIRNIISYFNEYPIVAVKAVLFDNDEHFNTHFPDAAGKDYFAIKETKAIDKDSGRYLKSGAHQAWFLAATRSGETKLLRKIDALCNVGKPVILESNVLRKFIKPAVFIMLVNPERRIKASAKEMQDKIDLHLNSGNQDIEQIASYLKIEDNQWKFNRNNRK
jgi:hypothetical protein